VLHLDVRMHARCDVAERTSAHRRKGHGRRSVVRPRHRAWRAHAGESQLHGRRGRRDCLQQRRGRHLRLRRRCPVAGPLLPAECRSPPCAASQRCAWRTQARRAGRRPAAQSSAASSAARSAASRNLAKKEFIMSRMSSLSCEPSPALRAGLPYCTYAHTHPSASRSRQRPPPRAGVLLLRAQLCLTGCWPWA